MEDNIKRGLKNKMRVYDWIHVAQNKDYWRFLLKTAIKLWVLQEVGD
jgi:hypothetical protein